MDAREPLTHASTYIEGLGYRYVAGFDPGNPRSWYGNEIHFALIKNNAMPAARAEQLLTKEFAEWNWHLAKQPDGSFIATHIRQACTPMRSELGRFFVHLCDEP
jgi:hypothetical protein